MSPEKCMIIREEIMKAAEQLKDRLPESDAHPSGRNPWAHVAKVIKSACNDTSYRDMPDESFEHIIELIKYCKENPF